MNKVLVVYASRHGATRGIAQRIGDVLRSEGLEAEVAPADHAAGVGTADAVVVGSAVYMGSWLKEGIDFIKRNEVCSPSCPCGCSAVGRCRAPRWTRARAATH